MKNPLINLLRKSKYAEIVLRTLFMYCYLFVQLKFNLKGPESGKKLLIINHHFDQDVEALHLANKRLRIATLKFNHIFFRAKFFFIQILANTLSPTMAMRTS